MERSRASAPRLSIDRRTAKRLARQIPPPYFGIGPVWRRSLRRGRRWTAQAARRLGEKILAAAVGVGGRTVELERRGRKFVSLENAAASRRSP
jgi:hypothetical protein